MPCCCGIAHRALAVGRAGKLCLDAADAALFPWRSLTQFSSN